MAAPSFLPFIRGLVGISLSIAMLVPSLSAETVAPPKVREPSVAGIFYPRDPAALAKEVSLLLGSVPPADPIVNLKAIVCPHAGYAYSGPVAARAYRQAAGGGFTTVVVLAPSHTAFLTEASVSDARIFRTPLGDTAISERARELAKLPPFSLEPKCQVQRPGWWQSSRKLAPLPMDDRADTWEHADEVQVPFIQIALPEASVLPVIMGEVNPSDAARALSRVIDDKTLIVASSDLSHFHPYEEARALDAKCIDAICRLDPAGIGEQSACGRVPIRTVIELARQRGWKAKLLDYRNSGDTAGDKSRVVGYAAIAFYAPSEKTAATPAVSEAHYTVEERRALLSLARKALSSVVSTGRLPEPEASEAREKFQPLKGCFVTLTKQGELRG
ncbi:MAG: AmmeMemoRadiSam system protein B, partial [Opitutaceae bacterium]